MIPVHLSRRALLTAVASASGAALMSTWAKAAAPRRPALVIVWLNGGPSHVDSFDPKPGVPEGGPFGVVSTSLPGVQFTEHLPRLAALAGKCTVVRGLTSREGNHDRARYLLHTGYAPSATVQHPAIASWVSRDHGPVPSGLPGYVTLAGPGFGAGFLGVAHGPFVVRDAGKAPPDMVRGNGVDDERWARRRELLDGLEGGFTQRTGDGKVAGRRALYGSAFRLMESPSQRAFLVSEEPASVQSAYGDHPFGRGCLVARRLVEAGVPAVEVTLDGWDTHQDGFPKTSNLLRTLDGSLGALLEDLEARGLLATTTVACLGEFGRTPRINGRGGRDHHPAAFSALLAGGRLRPGVVHGATDGTGAHVARDPLTVPDLFATLAVSVGLDPAFTLPAARSLPSGPGAPGPGSARPISLTDHGVPVAALLGGGP